MPVFYHLVENLRLAAEVERRRRENRGAEGTDGVECGKGYPPPHLG